jgi:branched-chain amino acid transport system ATP-binding protein
MTPALLQVDRLSKRYGAIDAVCDVSFAVAPGEIVGVIGPNGSGKTTLFNAILGQAAPSAGRVHYRGEDITGKSALHISRKRIGRTFQALQVFASLSVRDNLIAAAQEFRGTMMGRLVSGRNGGLGARAD